jgi:hypothetical protein
MEILKCYEGGNKEKATKWEKISPTTGGNVRLSVRLVSLALSLSLFFSSFEVLYGRTEFQSEPLNSKKFIVTSHIPPRTPFFPCTLAQAVTL